MFKHCAIELFLQDSIDKSSLPIREHDGKMFIHTRTQNCKTIYPIHARSRSTNQAILQPVCISCSSIKQRERDARPWKWKRERLRLRVRRHAALLPRGGAGGGVVYGAEERVHEAEDAADGEEPVARHHPALRQLVLPVGQRAEDQQRQPDDEDHPAQTADTATARM